MEGEITRLLNEVQRGNTEAMSRLVSLVQTELHRIARRYMRKEARDHTIQATALVNEAYLQLVRKGDQNWQNRSHFFAASACLMRHILVDYARSRNALKRGSGKINIPLDECLTFSDEHCEDALLIDQALTRLSQRDPRMGQIVEMRFFAGLTEDEIALTLKVSARTVKRDWKVAKAFLQGELSSLKA
jgi:RNA polymerase sigma factor (TIGR02999 family)